MSKVAEVLEATRHLPPQTGLEVVRGSQVRRSAGGMPLVRLHYSANPERDPDLNP
jgi:hypothetical protein